MKSENSHIKILHFTTTKNVYSQNKVCFVFDDPVREYKERKNLSAFCRTSTCIWQELILRIGVTTSIET